MGRADAEQFFAGDIDRKINGSSTATYGCPVSTTYKCVLTSPTTVGTLATDKSVLDTSIAAATSGSTFLLVPDVARSVNVRLSGAGVRTVTVTGTNILGRTISESFTTNGTANVVGKKAFKTLTSWTVSAVLAGTNLEIGLGKVFGLPFLLTASSDVISEGYAPNGTTFSPLPTTAGSILHGVYVAGSATSTADMLGTWTPATDPNGTRSYFLYYDVQSPNSLGLQ